MVLAADAGAAVRDARDARPVAAREDAVVLAITHADEPTPFAERQNRVVVIDQPLAKLPLLGAALLEPSLALLLALALDGWRARFFSEGHWPVGTRVPFYTALM